MSIQNLLSFTIICFILISIQWHRTVVNAEQNIENTSDFFLASMEKQSDTNGTIISRKGQEKSIDIQNDNQTIVNHGNDNEGKLFNLINFVIKLP